MSQHTIRALNTKKGIKISILNYPCYDRCRKLCFLYKISELNESQLGFERQLSKWKISVFRL